jgi:hypothetical protein
MANGNASGLLSKYLDEEIALLEIHNPNEVSIVPAGMNRQVFGIRKEHPVFDFNALNEVPLANQAQIDTITKGMTDDAKGAVVAIAKAAAAFKDAIPADVLSQACGVPMIVAEAKPVEAPKTAIQKAMEDPELAAYLAKEQAEKVEIKKALGVERNARLAKEWVEKAAAYKSVSTLNQTDLGTLLRDASEHLSKENFDRLTKHLTSCEAISADLCKATGKTQNEPSDSSALVKLEQLTKEKLAANKGMTEAEAHVAIYKELGDEFRDQVNEESR